MSNLSTLPKGDSAWLLRKAIERIIQQVSVLETNIGASTSGNSANTQIIFNDNGTLRGDAGLVYNKTTDTLTAGSAVITGAATITGDLTVHTSTLKVDSTNHRVGIGTASPSTILDIQSAGAVYARIYNTTSTADAYLLVKNTTGEGFFGINATGPYVYTAGSLPITFTTATSERYRIAADGVATWQNVGGVAGTAMTLNSTGLGIGVSPSAKLHVNGEIKIADTYSLLMGTASEQKIFAGGAANNTYLTFSQWTGAAYTERMRIDQSGNVGIGITPSAWGSSYKSVQATLGAALAGATGNLDLAQNCYYNGTNWVNNRASTFSSRYDMNVAGNGAHAWYVYNSSFGTVGNTIPFTQAMTLRADGALLVGCTTAPNPGAATTVSGFSLNGDGNNAYISSKMDNGSCGYFRRDGTDGVVLNFYKANNSAGTISVTPTVCTFNSVSDYRLKEAVKPITNGLTRVNALKPASYKWKLNGSDGEGFLAHELSEVVPIAVTGEKDAVNADGSIDAQAIDMSRIVPILVAAIQELTARVKTLESR